ncbi:unnamed protein product [Caenorhabditis auriculariae]|uniref:Uncharacterized protein n=1 Tax=Caenorhabditis auriculariae TaxID=2777116 RepID=A0A8S1GYF9_9PELO|nr:unnamed protein product [Caenorhabditis auriculariae]
MAAPWFLSESDGASWHCRPRAALSSSTLSAAHHALQFLNCPAPQNLSSSLMSQPSLIRFATIRTVLNEIGHAFVVFLGGKCVDKGGNPAANNADCYRVRPDWFEGPYMSLMFQRVHTVFYFFPTLYKLGIRQEVTVPHADYGLMVFPKNFLLGPNLWQENRIGNKISHPSRFFLWSDSDGGGTAVETLTYRVEKKYCRYVESALFLQRCEFFVNDFLKKGFFLSTAATTMETEMEKQAGYRLWRPCRGDQPTARDLQKLKNFKKEKIRPTKDGAPQHDFKLVSPESSFGVRRWSKWR